MGSVAGHVLRSSVHKTLTGAIPVALPSLSLPLTSALPTMLFPVTMAVGVTLLGLTSTSPCLCFLRLLNTVPELSLSLTAGNLCSSPSPVFLCPLCEHMLLTCFSLFFTTCFFYFIIKNFSNEFLKVSKCSKKNNRF